MVICLLEKTFLFFKRPSLWCIMPHNMLCVNLPLGGQTAQCKNLLRLNIFKNVTYINVEFFKLKNALSLHKFAVITVCNKRNQSIRKYLNLN